MTNYIFEKVGDQLDRKVLNEHVDLAIGTLKLIVRKSIDTSNIKQDLSDLLEQSIAEIEEELKTSKYCTNSFTRFFTRFYEKYPTTTTRSDHRGIKNQLQSKLSFILNCTRDAKNGDTSNYGYKVWS